MGKRTRSSRHRNQHRRRGIALVEGSIVLSLALIILLTMLDMSIALMRYHEVCRAAQQIARLAQVHGEQTIAADGIWGPTGYAGNADDSSKIASVARRQLFTTPHDKVLIQVSWPNANCQERSPVQVKLNYLHRPLFPLLWLNQDLSFQTTCMMQVTH